MTCELCNRNRMDVKTWTTAGGHIVIDTCTPCTRKIIDIELKYMGEFREEVKYLIDTSKALVNESEQQAKKTTS